VTGEGPEGPGEGFPGPVTALWLSLGSWLACVLIYLPFVQLVGHPAALGIGLVAGLGGSATLAARAVPPPQAERLGLRGFSPRFLVALLLLLPAALLVSELDNVVGALAPAAPEDAAPLPGEAEDYTTLQLVELVIVLIGLAPVVEEFLFRGVLQQGLVVHLGGPRGVLAAAALYALGRGFLIGTSPHGPLSAVPTALVLGALFGWVRLATGSLVAAIGLSMAITGSGFLALAYADQAPIPGFNAPGDHTPAGWLVPATVSVALGLWLLSRQAARQAPAAPPGELP